MEKEKVNTKLLLFTLVLVLIVLLIFNYLLKNNSTDSVWNYKELTSGTDIIYLGKKIEDRQIYYNLEKIVTEYVNSYLPEGEQAIKDVTYEDYYDALSEKYKNYLGKNKYYEVAQKFLKKFYINVTSDYETMEYMDTERIIKNIYVFENYVYLCELETSDGKNTGYIAIQMNTENNSYCIMYIE